jgi:hypothetical protein
MKNSEIKSFIELLPHGFNSLYWNLANTTYSEETFLALIKSLKIKQERALKLQSKIFPGNRLLRKILKNEVSESMGVYGDFKDGDLFYD